MEDIREEQPPFRMNDKYGRVLDHVGRDVPVHEQIVEFLTRNINNATCHIAELRKLINKSTSDLADLEAYLKKMEEARERLSEVTILSSESKIDITSIDRRSFGQQLRDGFNGQ